MSPPRSLEQRLLVIMAVTALVFAMVGGSLVFMYGYTNEQARSRQALDGLVATVHSAAQIAAFVHNELIAQDIAAGLLRNDEIRAVTIESADGYRFSEWGERVLAEWNPQEEIAYPLYSPIDGGQSIGALVLLTDSSLLAARARAEALRLIILLAALMLVLALIGVITFRRLVSQPLKRLTDQLMAVEPGTGERFVVPPGHDRSEIGLLAGVLNRYLEASEEALASERALRERVEAIEAHYRRIFESASVGVMVLDMNGALINCNRVMQARIDRTSDNGGTGGLFARLFCRPDKAWRQVERALNGGGVVATDLELVGANAEQGPQWVHCLLSVSRDDGGDFAFIEAVLYDVTSRRQREEEALRTAERDALTDLVNRRGAEAYIDRAIDEAHRNDLGLTLLYIDLDAFKPVNDVHGHAAGDAVLVEVAARLHSVLRRSSDLVARLGGDEFILAAYDCHKHDATVAMLAESVLDALGQPFELPDGSRVKVGASIGVAGYPEDGVDWADLLYAADQAMYEAKQAGRNRFVISAAGSGPLLSDRSATA